MTDSGQERKLLVLDLDETLIHATREPLARQPDFWVGPYAVYRRPHLSAFLTECWQRFIIGVWTSAGPDYAAEVVKQVFPACHHPAFVWASTRCTWAYDAQTCGHVGRKYLRKLKRLGYDLEKILMVDDSPEKHVKNYGNLIRVRPYLGQEDDMELKRLLPFLEKMQGAANVRTLEKRHWRQGTSPNE